MVIATDMPKEFEDAYYDLFPIAPGTESWAISRIPTADKMWELVKQSIRDMDLAVIAKIKLETS